MSVSATRMMMDFEIGRDRTIDTAIDHLSEIDMTAEEVECVTAISRIDHAHHATMDIMTDHRDMTPTIEHLTRTHTIADGPLQIPRCHLVHLYRWNRKIRTTLTLPVAVLHECRRRPTIAVPHPLWAMSILTFLITARQIRMLGRLARCSTAATRRSVDLDALGVCR